MDTKLVGRVIDASRTVNPLQAVSEAVLDLEHPPASGSLRAQVAARLADGTFRVLIDGKALKLALPNDVKAGDVLQLRVVGRGAVAAPEQGTAAGFTGRGVSTAGQLVADLVRLPSTAPPRQAQPVVPAPPDSAPEGTRSLAAPLARAVERSGLFYESHLARWVNGEFPVEGLLDEPQALALKLGLPHASEAPQAAAAEGDSPPSPPVPLRFDANDETGDDRPVAIPHAKGIETKVAEESHEIVARETLPVVRQQLEILETRHFSWLGEIWPGQPMQWQIGESPEDGNRGTEDSPGWDSRFVLDLPALGNVGAELALVGSRLAIKLSAEDPATVSMMRESANELIQALSAAGVEPLSFEVRHRAPSL